MGLEELERRIMVLEDIEAIKKLKARYCACADDSYDADAIAALFAEDATWEGKSFGRYEGREAIREFIRGMPRLLSFASPHLLSNPIIEVEGTTATGQWYLLLPCTLAENDQAAWLTVRYDERYVKLGNGWKFKAIDLTPIFMTPFDKGWAKQRFVG